MADPRLEQFETKMNKTFANLEGEFQSIRAGRANPHVLDKIRVDYYGTPTPIQQVGNVSVPEPRTLMINPWDKTAMSEIEKAIRNSDLGLNPTNDGQVIRIAVPALTEERRRELVKNTKKLVEETKVICRNARRDAIDAIKQMKKDALLNEDDAEYQEKEVQKKVDEYTAKYDALYAAKEKEIMEV